MSTGDHEESDLKEEQAISTDDTSKKYSATSKGSGGALKTSQAASRSAENASSGYIDPAYLRNKLKSSRASVASWLTRAVAQYEAAADAPSVLEALKQRIATQLRKLQDAHDKYMDTLEDEEEINTAEDWMETYFYKATKCLAEIEGRLRPSLPEETLPPMTGSAATWPTTTGNNPILALPLLSANSQATEPSPIVPSNSLPSPSALSESSPPTDSIDSWIDKLTPGEETVTSKPTLDLAETLTRLEVERDLPKVELPVFDGSPIMWPKFVEQFYVQVHSRAGLGDARRMDLLQSHVKGEAKRLIEGLGYSGRNYALSLKELKFAFGHRIAVARAYIDSLCSGNALPPGDPAALRNLYVSVRDCIATLKQMNYSSEISSSDVLRRTLTRIPSDKRVKWNEFVRNITRTRDPTLMDLESWLRDCVEAEYNPFAIPASSTRRTPASTLTSLPVRHTTMHTTTQDSMAQTPCSLCSRDHQLSRCKEYLEKSPEDRYDTVKGHRLCFSCLGSDHRIAECPSLTTCKVTGCSAKHHTTLHRRRQPAGLQLQPTQPAEVNNLCSRETKVYFQVVPVVIQGRNGSSVHTCALLDSASDITLINSELAKDLGLKGRPERLTLNTVSSSTTLPSKRVSFSVRASGNPSAQPIWIQEAWTRPGSFRCTPINKTDIKDVQHLSDLQLADIDPTEVKLLIGANIPKAHLQISSRQGNPDAPIAIETQLGWCLLGSMRCQGEEAEANVNLIASEAHLCDMVEQFWKTEAFGVAVKLDKSTSVEDQRAATMLQQGTKFENGHYEVPMLWRNPQTQLPDNRIMAERRFNSLVKRLSLDPQLKSKYAEVMNSYITKGYACKLTPEEINTRYKKTWYLPHHCVINPNKPSKVRVVFDAAAECDGVSLNNQLMTGPDLMNSLFSVIQLFRMQPVALVADIAEMFHQVRVPEQDSEALRFVWKQNLDEPGPPDIFRMKVHIFGATDSPCCVNFALRQAALEADDDVYLQAKKVIVQNFYVDDMLKAVDSDEEGITLARRITRLLEGRGFHLTKWMSSSREVLASVPPDSRAEPQLDLDLDDLPVQRALGIMWDVSTDSFIYKPALNEVSDTKRGVISTVSSIFDPCGFLAPFSFRAKLLIQDLWRADLDWDDVIPERLLSQWRKWCGELSDLSCLHIPRFHGLFGDDLELHVFCDASEAGFAAVAYVRAKEDADSYRCSFLASKTHVAPIKQVLTIPKLELQGAVMAVRLGSALREDLQISKCLFWTDAVTVLRYIHNMTMRWKIFVANRIAEIHEHTQPEQWYYVPSKSNPADCATRGMSAQDIVQNTAWLQGPDFLQFHHSQWPNQPEIKPPDPSDEGLRTVQVNTIVTDKPLDAVGTNIAFEVDVTKFSAWCKLLRHVAWILRAVGNFKSVLQRGGYSPERTKSLSPMELQKAEICLIRLAQVDGFKDECSALQRGEVVQEKSSLQPLDPFYDDQLGLIRVGGRLRKSPYGAEFKHQFLLPPEHHITRLLAADAHHKLVHCGVEHVISTLRQRFWPLRCRQLVKKIIHECLYCRRRSAQPKVPMMADLPQQRTGATRPFQYTGLDYFGPMNVKRARSTTKKWGCLFTCLVTRAVHLELADSLQTDDFIMVLRCFISRRGQPTELFSDNGTNFKGADRELQENLDQLDQERIANFLHCYYIKWNFIPPHAPHFGGAWERLVGSVKRTLKAILREQCVTEAVLRTALAEVEAVINSRPLTYNSSDTQDFSALTPNHFLHGGATVVNPVGRFSASEINSRRRWRQSQVLADHLWKRWTEEYLPTLTVRSTWRKEQRNLQVDDLVMLVDDNAPRGQWLLGRVIDICASEDGRVRSATVKTAIGTYCRPASKICVLEEC